MDEFTIMNSASTDFDRTWDQLRQTALSSGTFLLRHPESINDVVVREQVSKGFGVYVISCREQQSQEVLYIGKAGTVCQDGRMGEQGIKQRLKMKQGGTKMYRKEFFLQVIRERNLEALHFEWFETYQEGQGVPPFLAEAELLAAFLRSSGRLPALNKTA